jgi:hypothetical protein
MAYSTMTTRSAGYVVPASEWNQLLANDEACAVAAFTTKGDLFAGTGSKAGARLAAGGDYWGPIYLASATPGMVKAPTPQVMQANGFASEISNDNTEKTLCTISIPANFLSTNQSIIYELDLLAYNNKGSNGVVSIKAYYGASYVSNNYGSHNTVNNGASWSWFRIWAICAANGATNAQSLLMLAALQNTPLGAYAAFPQTVASAAVDSTSAQTAKLTATMDAANSNFKFRLCRAAIYAAPVGAAA